MDRKQISLIRASSDASPNSIKLGAFIFPRLANPEARINRVFLPHRCLSTHFDRALYYSNLCAQPDSIPSKKIDIIKEIKQRLAKVTARKTLTEKPKQKKKFFWFKKIEKPLKSDDKTPELRVNREVLIEKRAKRKV